MRDLTLKTVSTWKHYPDQVLVLLFAVLVVLILTLKKVAYILTRKVNRDLRIEAYRTCSHPNYESRLRLL